MQPKVNHTPLPKNYSDIFSRFLYLSVIFTINLGKHVKLVFLSPFVFLSSCIHGITKLVLFIFHKASSRESIYHWRKTSFHTIAGIKNLLLKLLVVVCKTVFTLLRVTIQTLVRVINSLIIKPFRLLSLQWKYFLFGFIFCLGIVSIYGIFIFIASLPSPKSIGKLNFPLSTHIFDRNGKLLYEVYRDQNRTPIRLKELPVFVSQSTIAIEDKDFYYHNGVSLFSGVLRAMKETIFGHKLQGGSTITQQLVKTALLSPEQTLSRKFKEIFLALWTERLYSKDQILEMYLNQVPYGGSSYGIEEAAKTYFGKDAKNLSLSEAALLSGLPQAPSSYSPFTNPSAALTRRNEVLLKMREQNFITKDQEKRAKLDVPNFIPPKTSIRAPHFVFYIKSQLENDYGVKQVEEGGMRVTTTLDVNIQEKAELILKEELAKVANLNVGNGAIIVTRPKTGEILAMVGSVDYFGENTGAFNVTTALRQPGSSIKPLMYSLALQHGYTAASVIDDVPMAFVIPGTETYRPVNYDGKFHGKVTLRSALANSFNIPAVRIFSSLGVTNFVTYARDLGITTWNDPSQYGLSLTLGGGEVTMLDMATAFGSFANEGDRVDVGGILRLDTPDGNKLYESFPLKKRVMSSGVAYIISDVLSDNVARQQAFGPHSALEIPGFKVAVKTGTTDNKKDNWTVGYTPDFLVVVWVGNNDGAPMNPYLASGITGAAPVWNRVMTELLTNYSDNKTWFNQPDDVTKKRCYYGKEEYFLKGTEQSAGCQDSQLQFPTPTPGK